MAAPPLRRGFQALAVCCTSAFLLILSLALTTSAFLAWHFISTRPHHTLPFYFELVEPSSLRPALQGHIALSHAHGLRSVQELTVSVHLLLPESRINLDNSVFHVSAELYGRPLSAPMLNATRRADEKFDGLCLARGSAQAALQYRSPVYRAIRAVAMAGPLLLGLAREYQTVRVEALAYEAKADEDGRLPLLDGIRVRLYPGDMQVAEAKVRLHVVRRSFLGTMVGERRVVTFLAVAIGLWYVMLIGLGMVLVVASVVRKAVGRVWGVVAGVAGEEGVGNVGDTGEVSDQVSEVSGNRPREVGVGSEASERLGACGNGSETVISGSRSEETRVESKGLRKRTSSSVTRVT